MSEQGKYKDLEMTFIPKILTENTPVRLNINTTVSVGKFLKGSKFSISKVHYDFLKDEAGNPTTEPYITYDLEFLEITDVSNPYYKIKIYNVKRENICTEDEYCF